MARALRDDHLTPADELRSLLAQSEKRIVNLRGDPSNGFDLLNDMDRIAALWPELEAVGADLRAEEGRWETLQAAVHQAAPRLLRALRPLGGLPALRTVAHPDGQAAWWWRLDDEVASANRRRLKRMGIIGVGIVALLVVAGLLFRILFPVDPLVQEAAGKIIDGQNKIQMEADYSAALPLFRDAVALTPGDPEAWLWLGATQRKLGDVQSSAESFRRAAALTPDQVAHRSQKATVYQVLGMLDEAASEVEAVLALDAENPQAYLIQASISEARGQYPAAIESLQKAADLADQRNEPQVSATARYQLGFLLQRLPIVPPASATPAGH
jgi:tetratricopeptide (TPR) repeat protein